MGPAQARAWYVISLRPQGGHAALRRAAARAGAGLVALSPWRLQGLADEAAQSALRVALQAPSVVFTSPAAVRFAAALMPLRKGAGQVWIGTGAGTRNALRRAGIADAQSPLRMDSEGLLDMPALQAARVGLVTAPGGRDLLAKALQARGTPVSRADVYARQARAMPGSSVARLCALDAPACVALSSAQALELVLAGLPADAARRLRAMPAVAASTRLAEAARAAGFERVSLAEGPRPAQLVAAADAACSPRFV